MDFTHCTELGVTIGGEPFRQMLFHLVLSHSGWRYAAVCFGETFEALMQGLQGALWELGGVPSNCLGSQAVWAAVWRRVGSQRVWSRIMTLRIVSSFLIAAVSATFFALPASHSLS